MNKLIKKTKAAIKILKEKDLKKFWRAILGNIRLLFKIFYLKIFKSSVIKNLKDFSADNFSEIFDFVDVKFFENIKPLQIRSEFLNLLDICREQKPKIILEIGTANGGALFCFCKLAPDDGTIISIDLTGGNFGGGYPKWKTPIYQAFKKENQKLYLLREDSHKQETLDKLKNILQSRKIDFLFIDGDHSYFGVKKDFEMYSPLVKIGGMVAFHDIVQGPEQEAGGVHVFWKEIKGNYKNEEIIKDKKQGGADIGILYK